MKPPKILIDATKLKSPHNGLDTFLRAYIKELETLSEAYPFDIGLLLPKKNIPHFETNLKCIRQALMKRKQIYALSKKYDLWHSTFHTINKPSTNDCLHVATVHDLNPIYEKPHKKNSYLKKSNAHLQQASHIVSISEYTQSDILKHHPKLAPKPHSVIYNGVNKPDTGITPTPPPNKKFLFALGAFMRKKNYEAIIEMMPFIDTNIDLIIAGSSNGNYINELAQIAEKIGIENRVKLIPNISPSEKNWYLNHCSAFLFPSKLEGFGLPPAEAMQCGKTPFIFEATSIPEVVGKAGVYWMSADPESMANKVNQFIIEELDMCTSQKKICLRQADKFCWKQMTHNYLDLFKNLLKDQI